MQFKKRFDSFTLLSDCIHAPGADYEIIIACTVGKVTPLIENSRSLPYLGKLGQYDTASVKLSQSLIQWPIQAFSSCKVTTTEEKYSIKFFICLSSLSPPLLCPSSLPSRYQIATVAHIPHLQTKTAACKTQLNCVIIYV